MRSPEDERNLFYQRHEPLPGVSTFSWPGAPIDIVKVTDPLILAQMPDDADMVAVPVFTRSVGHAVKGWLGIDDQRTGTAVEQYSLNGDSLQGGALRDSAISSLTSTNSAPSYNLAPVFNLNLEASVPLTIASDSSRLSDYIDFQARASQASFAQALTLSALSGQSSTGG